MIGRFQDALSYIVVLLCVTLFLLLDWMNLYSAIILLALGIIYLIVLVYTDEIKEQIEDWLSLNDEEQEYSSDEHFHCRRRRESSS
jgi:Ca2+/Na+ antiporter